MAAFKSVLLVDDSRATNFMHRELIREADFAERIDVALDGEEALDFLRSGSDSEYFPPSVIFLDINMPKMDGFEFLEACKSLPEGQRGSLVIVMLTTSLDPGDRTRRWRPAWCATSTQAALARRARGMKTSPLRGSLTIRLSK
jgi:CheY-like chemotaxis protein